MMENLGNHSLPDHTRVLDQAIQNHQAGRASAAETGYRRILADNPDQPDALHLLGMLTCDRGNAITALSLIDAAIGLKPDRAAFQNTRARALTMMGRLAEAEAAYRIAWALRPDTLEIANNLGCLLRDRGDIEGAVEWLSRAAVLAPESVEIAGNLANALAADGAHAASLMMFRHALLLCPNSVDLHYNLAGLLLSLGRLDEAERSYRAAIQLRPGHAPSENNLGLVLQERGHGEAAAQCFRNALRSDPHCTDAHYNLGCLLQLDNQIDGARDCHDRALQVAPLHGPALWARCMVELPILYETPAQIPQQRLRYAQRLEALAVDAADPEVAQALAAAVGASQPFLLPYQGECDRSLQATYGTLVARLLQPGTPPLVPPQPPAAAHARPTQAAAHAEKIRVGIVSGYFCEHTIWRLMLKGWLSQFDRSRFSIHAYHTAMIEDDQTALARGLCSQFVGGRGVNIRAAILADRPHVLLYPELGMDPLAARLAGERLAMVQCASWGQPVTSGLPTMDFFLSSALMEPEDGATHYSERLVTLPKLGIYYTPDEREASSCSRAALGLRDDAMVFWCGQALYKYLPQHDDVFARIAAEVGDCQFLFIGFAKSRAVTQLFRSRLRQAFAARGLNADRYCLFLEPMSQEDFLGTVRLADIVLDSIGWSGGKSTLDALAEAPVIVTYAGTLMRGRHTMAILMCVGITETIAVTIDDYVDIAVRLARDPKWRLRLRVKMAAGRHRAMTDKAPIRALETFFAQAVAQRRTA